MYINHFPHSTRIHLAPFKWWILITNLLLINGIEKCYEWESFICESMKCKWKRGQKSDWRRPHVPPLKTNYIHLKMYHFFFALKPGKCINCYSTFVRRLGAVFSIWNFINNSGHPDYSRTRYDKKPFILLSFVPRISFSCDFRRRLLPCCERFLLEDISAGSSRISSRFSSDAEIMTQNIFHRYIPKLVIHI